MSCMQSDAESGIVHQAGAPSFLNTRLMAINAFEIDIPEPVIAALRPIAAQVRDLEERGETHRLGHGLRLYVERPREWRSDICWISHADEPTYRWFEDIYRGLGLAEAVAPYVPHDRAIPLYAGFFVTRSRCDALDMHYDWLGSENHAFTLMAPLTDNAGGLGMTYETLHRRHADFTYRVGKGLVFGSRFCHSTSVGRLDERAVFLCMNFGTDRMEHWPELARTTGTQGDFFRQPDGSFIHRADWEATTGQTRRY